MYRGLVRFFLFLLMIYSLSSCGFVRYENKKAEEQGIDWNQVWPDLESIEITE